MDLVLYTCFPSNKPPHLAVYKGTEEQAAEQADMYLAEGADVIYFYAKIETITLREY